MSDLRYNDIEHHSNEKEEDHEKNFILTFIKNLFPVFKWMPSYTLSSILPDLIAGITVAAVILPQSMAYSMLAGLPPVIGLYSAIFPILLYFFMGTSKHLSVGPFALTSLLINNSISQLLPKTLNSSDKETIFITSALVITFVAGCYKTLVGISKLGSILVKLMILSEAFMSAFIFSSAIMIITSVLGQLTGIGSLPNNSGLFLMFEQYIYLFENLNKVNIAEMILCIISVAFVLLFRKFNEIYYPKIKLPDFLFLLVITTVIVYLCDLHYKYDVTIVGNIPSGLPNFTLIDWNYGNLLSKINTDPFTFTKSLCFNALTLSIISIFITLAIVIKFAIQFDYLPEVDYNQEMIALGMSSCVCYFVPCFVSCGSLSRSVILAEAGAKSLYATLLQVLVVVVVLLFASGILKYVSTCVLATIIVVAFSKIVLDIKDSIKFWNRDKLEFSVWLCTCLSIFIFNLENGFYVAFAWSMIVAFYRYLHPLWALLGVSRFEYPEYFDLDNNSYDISKLFFNHFFKKDNYSRIAKPVQHRTSSVQLSPRSSISINRSINELLNNEPAISNVNLNTIEIMEDDFSKPLNIFTGVNEIKNVRIFKLFVPLSLELSINLRQIFISLCSDNPKIKTSNLVADFNSLIIDTSFWGSEVDDEVIANVKLFVDPLKECGVSINFVAQGYIQDALIAAGYLPIFLNTRDAITLCAKIL